MIGISDEPQVASDLILGWASPIIAHQFQQEAPEMLSKYEAVIALPPTKLLIGGDWGEAANGNRFATVDPATEEESQTFPRPGLPISMPRSRPRATRCTGAVGRHDRRGTRAHLVSARRHPARALRRSGACSKASMRASRSLPRGGWTAGGDRLPGILRRLGRQVSGEVVPSAGMRSLTSTGFRSGSSPSSCRGIFRS